MSNDLVVLDISHYQSTPVWSALRDAGIVGCIFKATEGTSYVDDTFHERYNAARNAGLSVSSYHFLRHGNIEHQMNHYIGTVQPDSGERMCLDWEDGSVTLSELKQAVEFLLDAAHADAHLNLQVAVYGSASFLQEHVPNKPDPILEKTSLWVARYSSQPPYFPEAVWPTWSLWQFTDSANVAGFGPVDGNRFNGSRENCAKWFGPAGAPVPVPPEPAPEPAEVVITTKGSVRVIVNGQVVTYE